ncbi:uncharacterized protein LOC143020520 [Oratosquilla oratoria]|uniref:uncharacterized protein LOC143020520 n=1 Tax=Oratosquilla oratoria TaxID=337810 RepID=UPI003F770DA4
MRAWVYIGSAYSIHHLYLNVLFPCTLQVLVSLVGVAMVQCVDGFRKTLKDKRYQDGAVFGNHRNQEDRQKYFEETLPDDTRRGYWKSRKVFENSKQAMVHTKSSFVDEEALTPNGNFPPPIRDYIGRATTVIATPMTVIR